MDYIERRRKLRQLEKNLWRSIWTTSWCLKVVIYVLFYLWLFKCLVHNEAKHFFLRESVIRRTTVRTFLFSFLWGDGGKKGRARLFQKGLQSWVTFILSICFLFSFPLKLVVFYIFFLWASHLYIFLIRENNKLYVEYF